MTSLSAYLPQDRLRALARNETLPDRSQGAALFTDISGFTPLTEKLTRDLGPRRGAEELTRQITQVFDALIREIENHGGSVIGFAGDAMTVWIDDLHRPAPQAALQCAFALQSAMRAFPHLSVKVAVATGPARRMVVGDPALQLFDVLAGETLLRMAQGEHLANKGEVLADEATIHTTQCAVSEWRTDPDTGLRFGVLAAMENTLGPTPRLEPPDIAADVLRPWLHPALYERARSGQGEFLAEFRPVTTLFLRFSGIDYDNADAPAQLSAYIRWVEQMVYQHEGFLRAPMIGDKGSFLLIAFGAPLAHENDTHRALLTALALLQPPEHCAFITRTQIGMTHSIAWAGPCGGPTRHGYDFMGDEVNLAARLMQAAGASEILVSAAVQKNVARHILFEPRPPLKVKGKAEPQTVFVATGARQTRAIRLQEPTYTLPMVGRASELQRVNEKLNLAAHGQAQVIGIVAEAGLGKSRLVAEIIRMARQQGFAGYGGACQADGLNTPYLVWKSIWQAFFDLDPEAPARRQIRQLEGELEDRAPLRRSALPLLGSLLNVPIPENELTQTLEPKYRKNALHVLLEDCLHAAARETPTLIVIEDMHWIDALSHELLDELARALPNSAICFVLAYRPPEATRAAPARVEALPNFTRLELYEFTPAEAEQALRAKFGQLYPATECPAKLAERLLTRAQGNPFYLEELLNYLRDRDINVHDPAILEKLELPTSLHALILSRIDQLTENEKNTLRVASIVGRLFKFAWLTGYYPELGDPTRIKDNLRQLENLDITPLDTPEPELAYLFKHIATHEVAYESLLFSTRARLHEGLAKYLEGVVAPVETIAFHYGRSANKAKQREYFRKAGEATQKNFANAAALEYYGQLLPLLQAAQEQTPIYLRRGQVWELMGQWEEAERDYRAALESAQEDMPLKASAQFALGKLNRLRGEYVTALEWLVQANATSTQLADTAGLAQALIEIGRVYWQKGEYAQARAPLNEGLALAREAGDQLGAALALNNLGNVAWSQGDYPTARALYEESLVMRREMGDKWGIASALTNLGNVAWSQGDYPAARTLYEESLVMRREMGDKWGMTLSLTNLGNIALAQGDYATAQALYGESLTLAQEMGDKWGLALSLANLGNVTFAQGDSAAARAMFDESLALRREMGDKWGLALTFNNLGNVALAQGDPATARARYAESLALCQAMDEKSWVASNWLGLGLVDLAESQRDARAHILHSLRLRVDIGEQFGQISSLIGVVGLVLQEGNPPFAAQLLGAVAAALTALHAVVPVDVIHFHTQTLVAVKEALGEAAFQFAWAEGAKWTLTEAVQRALQEDK